ncbi:hypothetical protein EX30DRAFT_1244 [Ascodesmis nigricans]|uniref:DSC E3 ubiquitin ligase complex subunit 3 C-terminal domain-containing protein n=1 Tax=Ascodesmis nigricans TaxID=341454 RepID=A0A4S2N5I9_9PEZI|nr:hypothetical protein EX30DRAFT_1244 [Ascodesmis nigricans]
MTENDSHDATTTLALRFTIPLPDLPLSLPSHTDLSAVNARVLAVHRHLADSSLRYIHAGRILPLNTPLSSIPNGSFIHVSVSSLQPAADQSSPTAASSSQQQQSRAPLPVQREEPQGFDRLLSAGFTPAEVAALRDRFPDLGREGEERWIEEGVGAETGGQGSQGHTDTLRGVVEGFFWPLGALALLREVGMRRGGLAGSRGMAVLAGVAVNLLFGLVRSGS